MDEIIKKLIFEIGAEGGSITLFKVDKGEETRFVANTDESDLEDNFYHSEKSFNSLNNAVKYLYLKYPILDLYLVSVEPEFILPIAAIIKENIPKRNMDYDPVKDKGDDKVFSRNIRKITPENWKELGDLVENIHELIKNEISGNNLDRYKTEESIAHLQSKVYDINIVNSFNWPAWDEGRWLLKAMFTDFFQLDTVTLCKLVTAIVRNDRFCDGAWRESFRDGSMLSILNAIVQKNLPGYVKIME